MQYRKYGREELSLKVEFYKSLSEKRRRHFLALEYANLGKGSQRYIAEVFGCCRKTLIKGRKELAEAGDAGIDYTRQRKSGGGAKKKRRNNRI